MKSRYEVIAQIRAPPPIRSRIFGSTLAFADIPLPRAELFTDPAVASVARAPRSKQRTGGPRFFLINRPQTKPQLEAEDEAQTQAQIEAEAAAAARKSTFGWRMLNYAQIITAPTADTPGTMVMMHFDNQRYFFGQAAEGLQRALVQRKIGAMRIDTMFLSGPVEWRNAGGLLGMILTLADALASSKLQSEANNAAKQKLLEQKQQEQNSQKQQKQQQKKQDQKPSSSTRPEATTPSSLNIHAGKNISHLLATGRRFILRKGMPVRPHEIRSDPRPTAATTATTTTTTTAHSAEPDWTDHNIQVWYMPVEADADVKTSATGSPRKRRHDEFRGTDTATADGTSADAAADAPTTRSESSQQAAEAIVAHMFDSDWTMDALIETTLHQVSLPAKLFVRDKEGHLQVYTGPMPGDGDEVPDIPVYVRKPWPGAVINELPKTEPSKQSLCYIVKGHDRRGKFNPQAAERLGVAKQDYRRLTNNESVQAKDGSIVAPEMVLGATVPGSGFAMVDLPDISYIDALVGRSEWADTRIMNGVHVIFWLVGSGVIDDTRVQEFMQKMSSVKHIVTSPDTCPNMLALESVATQSYKLRCVDSDRFPIPAHSNERSVAETPVPSSSTYEVGRYIHQDDQIVPFPDIPKLARNGVSGANGVDDKVWALASQAKMKVAHPDFVAKVDKAEADIPNRDAEVISLGTGSALPSKYRNVSATLVRVPGYGNYLFDAGENTLGQLRRVFGAELPSVLRDLKVIWLSHSHADHILGTVPVIKAWNDATKESNPSAKLMVAAHSYLTLWLREYADVEEYGFERLVLAPFFRKNDLPPLFSLPRTFNDMETAHFGLTKIEGCWVNHCVGALATVFTFPSGLKIAYSGDCRPSDTFAEMGRGATLLIHEATFDDELKGDAIAKKHSTASEAISVGRQMGARRILLTHFSQRYQRIPNMEEDFHIPSDSESRDEVVLVAFDYMRVKLGDFRKAQAFLPAIQKLLEEEQQ
ncbi:hypothetical protein F4777DRAFT_588319 [Nemania sp. FL0916]|nr:hypothetical protein F4777DRAFT_588319 [Nemania sp. FL0916]